MKTEPQNEHQWLQKLVGEWAYESECSMEPGKPPEKFKGSESVRSLGGLWVQCEGRGEMPGGGMATTLMTLGYDPQKKQYPCGGMAFGVRSSAAEKKSSDVSISRTFVRLENTARVQPVESAWKPSS